MPGEVTVFPQASGPGGSLTLEKQGIETAKKLLDNERLTVRDVARRLCYPREFQLSRSFKRFEGVSPTDSRRPISSR